MPSPHGESASLDTRFRDAVAAIDSGDVERLTHLLVNDPELAHVRLDLPGAWLRDSLGKALDGFFRRPYLLWFVAEDPVRNGSLPANIADVAQVIIDAARKVGAPGLQEQLDFALNLVSWSWIAREGSVQIPLIDVLLDAGASPHGNPDRALVNGNIAAAEHLVARGAAVTLPVAVVLGRWPDVDRLASMATMPEKQLAFVQAALNGKANGLSRMLRAGAQLNTPSGELYAHGTPLHHAVSSGCLDAVQVLVDAGADVAAKDTAWGGTPLGWAHHYISEGAVKQYHEIAAYLEAHGNAA